MTKTQNLLLASVAAVALAAGTGLASAQAPSGGSQAGQRATHTGQGTGMQRQGMGSGMQAQGQSGGTLGKGQGSPQGGRQAQGTGSGTASPQAQGTGSGSKPGGVARTQRRGLHGLQGNAGQVQSPGASGTQSQGANAGMNRGPSQGAGAGTSGGQASVQGSGVRLSQQQRSRIRSTIINARNAPRIGHVTFGVNVGTVIPRDQFTTIHVVPVPEYLVRIEPRWRGLEYFIYSDEIVIVDPHDLRIVAIIPT